MIERNIEQYGITWREIGIEITFEPNWLSTELSYGRVAHLTITAINPARRALPITETGYLSHFTTAQIIADAGGPEAFVTDWLNATANDPAWEAAEASRAQLTLF
jgi:hypothetical protein